MIRMTGMPNVDWISCTADCGPCPRSWRSSASTTPTGERARRLDEADGLADGSARGQDVVHDQHAARERRADEAAALAMRLRLFPVVRDRHIAAVLLGVDDGSRRRERNALVSRAEEHVELDAGLDDRLRIAGADAGEGAAVIDESRVEEVGTGPARFQREVPKRSTCFARIISMNSFWCDRMQVLRGRCVSWPDGRGSSMRILTLNCNGIRSAASKGLFQWLPAQGADVVCLQETKAQEHQLGDGCFRPSGYHCSYFDAKRPGYSGVAIYSRQEARPGHRGFRRSGI